MAKNACSKSLADFKQLSLLGEGAYSSVYKVLRLADREIYALKKVKLPSLSDKEKQNALNEVRLLASIRHDSIISYKEAFFDDKTRCLCIIQEYANSGDLFQVISKCQKERQHPKEADVWLYLYGMCHGLKALHDMRILHRDLKCANVFLHTNPGCETVAKLGDFNVSKVAKRGLCMTQTGTPYYASPEVWRDMPYDAKSDMWSLGCVLYEMVALRPPFRAEDMEGLYKKVLRGQYPRIPPHFGNDMSEVIGVLLQVNPRHRPSIDQLLQMPVMRRHASCAEPVSKPLDLLNTIKLPKNAIDLSGCLPEPQYEWGIDIPPPSQESAADVAGGTSKLPAMRSINPGQRGQPLMPPPSEEGAPRLSEGGGYQDSLDAYLCSPPAPDPYQRSAAPPIHRAAPGGPPGATGPLGPNGQQSLGNQGYQGQGQMAPAQSPGPGHLPQISQDRGGGDSLDTYVQRQPRQRQQQRQQVPSEYGDYGAEDQRLQRHASPAPSAQSRQMQPGYNAQPQPGMQQAYGQGQYRQRRDSNDRRPMANYARAQYALGAPQAAQRQQAPQRQLSPGSPQAAQRQPPSQATGGAMPPPRQMTGGGGLRLPRIFTKAN